MAVVTNRMFPHENALSHVALDSHTGDRTGIDFFAKLQHRSHLGLSRVKRITITTAVGKEEILLSIHVIVATIVRRLYIHCCSAQIVL